MFVTNVLNVVLDSINVVVVQGCLEQFHYIWLTIVMALSPLWFMMVVLFWRLSLADLVFWYYFCVGIVLTGLSCSTVVSQL